MYWTIYPALVLGLTATVLGVCLEDVPERVAVSWDVAEYTAIVGSVSNMIYRTFTQKTIPPEASRLAAPRACQRAQRVRTRLRRLSRRSSPSSCTWQSKDCMALEAITIPPTGLADETTHVAPAGFITVDLPSTYHAFVSSLLFLHTSFLWCLALGPH